VFLIIYYWQSWKPFLIFSTPEKDHKQRSPSSFPQEMKKKISKNFCRHCNNKLIRRIVWSDCCGWSFYWLTVTIVKQFANVNLLQLKDDELTPIRKKAIENRHCCSLRWIIVTTDADCLRQNSGCKTQLQISKKNQMLCLLRLRCIRTESFPMLQIFSIGFLYTTGHTGGICL